VIRPPFTSAAATAKVAAIEAGWNAGDPERIVRACAEDAEWRDGHRVLHGRTEIRAFLMDMRDHRLHAQLWTFGDDRIAARVAHEHRDAGGRWSRERGYELWRFDRDGLLTLRSASLTAAPVNRAMR
jgi:nuclear transport factor 2 (NTF2) superfamily protein